MKTTEALNPRSADIDLRSTEEICRLINEEDSKVAPAVGGALQQIAGAVDRVVECVRTGGRLLYVGAGTSGRIGLLDAVECPPTFGISAQKISGLIAGGFEACYRSTEASEDDPSQGARDLQAHGIGKGDVVVGIAASGRTPYTCGALGRARELGAVTISISCNRQAELSRLADVPIEVDVGPEIIAGSTRMKCGTAQKLIVNMISTAAMVRLGMVYSHWMVNVQATNDKLRARALQILVEAARVAPEEAARLLDEARDLRTALVMALRKVNVEEARDRLSGASLREALSGEV